MAANYCYLHNYISPFLLSSKGFILLECGAGQAQDIIPIFTLNGFEHIKTLPDLAGIERCIEKKIYIIQSSARKFCLSVPFFRFFTLI